MTILIHNISFFSYDCRPNDNPRSEQNERHSHKFRIIIIFFIISLRCQQKVRSHITERSHLSQKIIIYQFKNLISYNNCIISDIFYLIFSIIIKIRQILKYIKCVKREHPYFIIL